MPSARKVVGDLPGGQYTTLYLECGHMYRVVDFPAKRPIPDCFRFLCKECRDDKDHNRPRS